MLREIEHPNIIELKDIVIEKKKLYLVLEYLDTDLKGYLDALPDNQYLEPMLIKVCPNV